MCSEYPYLILATHCVEKYELCHDYFIVISKSFVLNYYCFQKKIICYIHFLTHYSYFFRVSISCSVRTPIYRGKNTYFWKRVTTSLKSFFDSINLKNESARPKLVINDLLVDITNLLIFLQVEIQVLMAKNTIFH